MHACAFDVIIVHRIPRYVHLKLVQSSGDVEGMSGGVRVRAGGAGAFKPDDTVPLVVSKAALA